MDALGGGERKSAEGELSPFEFCSRGKLVQIAALSKYLKRRRQSLLWSLETGSLTDFAHFLFIDGNNSPPKPL
jgi:hypothetical protein